ncbi:MAG: cytochrome c oxidase, subunit [Ilumatobacteraceae bacterium]|nr:cytochrome c oxidase, subunit [Ilumatobacteraceae bacterium]
METDLAASSAGSADGSSAGSGAGSRRPSLLGVGVVVWLSSELMFFAGLFAAYFTLRAQTSVWPAAGVELSTARAGLATLVLIASSGTMHLAVRAGEHGDRERAVRMLFLTAALGIVFIANQGYEYATADFHVDSNAYGSIFYLLTGFHGLHVIGGIVFMLVVAGIVGGRTSKAPVASITSVCAYYWHFVDVVWIAVYLTVYVLK